MVKKLRLSRGAISEFLDQGLGRGYVPVLPPAVCFCSAKKIHLYLFESLCPGAAPARTLFFATQKKSKDVVDLFESLCPGAAPAGAFFSHQTLFFDLFESLCLDVAPAGAFFFTKI